MSIPTGKAEVEEAAYNLLVMAKVRPAMMAMKAMPEAAIATVIMAKATPTFKVAKATVMTAMIKATTVTSFSYICY
jgi:hypothetical protein